MTEKKILIAGTELKSFKAVANGANREWALHFCRTVAKMTGIYIELSESEALFGANVMFDATEMMYSKGSVKIERGNIIFRGSYHSLPIIIEKYLEKAIEADGDEIDLTESEEFDLCDTPKLYTKEELMKVLEYVYETPDLLIVGDEVDNSRSMPSSMLRKYFDASGTYPAIMGMDLGRCGLKLPTLPDNERHLLSRCVCEIVDYVAQGGIITFGCHFTNPHKDYERSAAAGNQDRGHIGGADAWKDLVTEGTEINKPFKRELTLDADFLSALRDNGVPVIWRPLHEMNGGWFWFSPIQGEEYGVVKNAIPDLWKYIYNYFTERGLDNLLWEYSPNNSNGANPANDVLYSYPGDEYVDMVGIDWYTVGNYEIGGSGRSYEKIMTLGKVANLAEFGQGGPLHGATRDAQEKLFTCKHVDAILDRMYADGYKIGYAMSYAERNSFVWWPHCDEFMASDRIVDLSGMPALFEKIREN